MLENETKDNDSPEGWGRSRLKDGLVDGIQPGFACGRNSRDMDGILHLRPMNVDEDGQIALRNTKYVPTSEADREERIVRAGDVIFNNTNSPDLVGKTAFYDLPGVVAFSNHMTRVRCRQEVLVGRFCAVALHHLWREGYFKANCNNHVSQASISRTVLEDTIIPVPPLAEQHRILAKLDEVLSRVNASRDRLARVPGILKRFRQAVLGAACSGRLTEVWRVQQGSDGWDGDGFPPGWTSTTLGELSSLVTSGSRGWARYYADSGAIFIRSQDISTDDLSLDDVAHVSVPQSAEGARTRVQQADLLVTITGANVAKAARVTAPLDEAYVSQHVALIRPQDSSTSPFLHLWLRSTEHARGELLDLAYGAGKPGLNLSNIRDVQVVLPPAPERDEIVRRVDAFLVLADSIESRVAAATVRADRLTQAVLGKAFRGELVPTEAELARQEGRPFESADELLARIRETPVEARPKRSPRGRRRSSST